MFDRCLRRVAPVAVLLALAVALAACGSSGGSKSSGSDGSTSSSSTPTADSAKGKPCVAVTDPLPAGAPEVPVQVGAPPAELVVTDLAPGTGAAAASTSTVVADYIGVSCSTGKIFDSSYSRGEPATFPLAQVIPGWQQGLVGMKVGGKRLLGIPAELAYGSQPPPGSGIAVDEPLWFVVELRNVTG